VVTRGVALPAATAAATFLAVSPCLRAYEVPGAAAFIALAAVASTTVTFAVVRLWRQRPVVSYSLSIVGLVAVLLAGSGLHPANVVRSIAQGPNRLLTETLPLAGPRSSVAVLVVLTWFCAAATSELLSRGGSTRFGFAAGLALPLACYVFAYSVSASAPGRGLVAGPLLFVVVAGVALARQDETQATTRFVAAPDRGQPDSRPPPFRRTATGAAVAILVTAVLAVAVPALPGMSRPPASLHSSAPTVAGDVVDPLDVMANLRDDQPSAHPITVLRVDLDRPSTGYLALAILDAYDGVFWRFDSTFEPTGGRIPAAPGAESSRALSISTVEQRITVEQPMPVPLLPALDRTSELTGVAVTADPSTAMILPGPGATGRFSYTAWSRTPDLTLTNTPSVDGISEASSAPGSPVTSSDLALPPDTSAALGTTLRFLATLTGERPAPTVAFLQALLVALHSKDRRVDPQIAPLTSPKASNPLKRSLKETGSAPSAAKAIGGTSLSQVINAVTVDRSATPEQFATLYAMVARYLGVPARVVTGFRLASKSSGGPIAAGSYDVTNRQAWAWVEIPVAGIGWVVADPTPDAVTAPGTSPSVQQQTSPTTLQPPQADAVPQKEFTGGHALARPSKVKVSHSHQVTVWAIALLVASGLLLVAVAAGPGLAGWRRVWRRRSRKVADPRELAVGAWLELLDGLNQAGMAAPLGSTTSEVAAEAGSHFGPGVVDSVRRVGAVADRAVFSLGDPPDASSAQEAWAVQCTLRREVHGSLDRRQRARALLSVGCSPRRPSGRGDRQ
jgi:transglutaminase TgpA-like protein/transglutaminase superfamily protein